MKKKFYLNPSYSPKWNEQDLRIFLYKCRTRLIARFGHIDSKYSFMSNYSKEKIYPYDERYIKKFVEGLYKEGRLNQVLACDFREFFDCITYEPKRGSYYHQIISQKYRKKPGHIKKIKSELQECREVWRNEIGLMKDKSKRFIKRSCPTSYKKQAHICHRAWIRDCLSHQKFEELMNSRMLNELQDPWFWD